MLSLAAVGYPVMWVGLGRPSPVAIITLPQPYQGLQAVTVKERGG